MRCIDEFVIEFKTINVPVVYMARDVMILMRATYITPAIERWALKIETFLGLKWQRAKQVPFQCLHLYLLIIKGHILCGIYSRVKTEERRGAGGVH